jgi:acyl carrier protein
MKALLLQRSGSLFGGRISRVNNQIETSAIVLVREQVRDFVCTNFLFNSAAPIDNDSSLMEQGIVDETGVLELVMFVEETYGIKVDEVDLIPEHFDSIDRISSYIAEHLASQEDPSDEEGPAADDGGEDQD